MFGGIKMCVDSGDGVSLCGWGAGFEIAKAFSKGEVN